MPSEDTFHNERPATNAWLVDAPEDSSLKPSTSPASSSGSVRASAGLTKQAAQVQRLARARGLDAEELAERIPEDTLRRLKYPVIEQLDEQGLPTFRHDIGIVRDGRAALRTTDQAHEAIPKGTGGKGAGVTQPRSASGKFSK